jgi:uncharacterized protein (TIGR03435 family)
MIRPFARILLLCLLIPFSSTSFGQDAPAVPADPHAQFSIANVSTSPHTLYPYMNGGQLKGDRYMIRDATLIDLVNTAYGIDEDNIFGGQAWTEIDRFDVVAQAPAGTPKDTLNVMLQNLLADRFQLAVHKDTKPVLGFVLGAPHGKGNLKASDGSDESGCKGQPQTPTPGAVQYNMVSCHNMTMAEFASQVHDMANAYLTSPVIDTTGLKGAWDFDLKWTGRGQLARAGDDGISIFDAVEKQLGLKLDQEKVPQPVLVIDSVNEKPTANPPDVAKILPPPMPTSFDVAVIKPSAPDKTQLQGRISGGQVNVQGATLKFLLFFAWDLNPNDDQQIVGAPKWIDSDHFDIVAKTVMDASANMPEMDQRDLEILVQNLLIDRFKLKAHMEDRPISAYTLMSDKPKLAKADPSNRTRCKEGPGADGKDPRTTNPILNRLMTCQNMSMTQFASMLPDLAGGYIYVPVKDATNLEGRYDFTLSFSGVGQLPSGPAAGPSGGGLATAADPSAAVSLMDAVNKQMGLKLVKEVRPVPVLVIDSIREQPTDN